MNIEVATNPDEKDSKVISRGIIDFNKSEITALEPYEAEVKFSVFARNQEENITGGIKATCYWNTLHVELFWLSAECRGKGVGYELIKSAEKFAKENNCAKAFVETTSWQAKPFYEKMGYKLMATLNDRPKEHSSHYLTKDLT
jgi:N-acetylglutamate synthase-like GNAT family acetyltransferase